MGPARTVPPLALLDLRMHDKSRLFGALPYSQLWSDLRRHLGRLPGATGERFVGNEFDGWLDFNFGGYAFSVNNHWESEYWFFVSDPSCPDSILQSVLEHFARLLGRPRGD